MRQQGWGGWGDEWCSGRKEGWWVIGVVHELITVWIVVETRVEGNLSNACLHP